MALETPDAGDMPQLGQAPAKPPVFGEKVGKRPKSKSQQPTFLGTGAIPTPDQVGSKTFLGM